jgi:hypothetical protein
VTREISKNEEAKLLQDSMAEGRYIIYTYKARKGSETKKGDSLKYLNKIPAIPGSTFVMVMVLPAPLSTTSLSTQRTCRGIYSIFRG